ncbi:SpoVG family protein [Lacrimispora sp. 38-1]|uniref:SpoVG family protein n=1 Tax=Lacrimispora sp. 38-1 TaxID=3125778 RepID=UPI003CEC71E9
MKYSIKVNDVKRNEGSLKGFATVTFGESFKVTNIAILQSGDGRMFVSMPRYKTNQQNEEGHDIYKDICNPITKEFREVLYADILEAFEKRDEKDFVSREKSVDIPEVTVSVTPYEREGSSMKALARVVLDDCFMINNVTVLEGRNGNNFVAMPGYKTNQKDEQGKDIFRDICFPVTAEFRTTIFNAVLADYEMKMKEQADHSIEDTSGKEQVAVSQNVTAKETPFR